MMNYSWGQQSRSTYHKTMVLRVNHYLKKKCDVASYEEELLSGYRIDAFGYNRKNKVWYLCEIKVEPSDLKKAPQQILDTKYHLPKTKLYHIGDTIVPVIAIPAKLANHLVKYNEWDSLCNTCKMIRAAIWVIEQSTVREVYKPRQRVARKLGVLPKAVKTKLVRVKTKTKNKLAKTKRPKLKVPKSTKIKRTRASKKRKATKSRSTKPKRTRTLKPKP
jgi:hypothetical protein